MTAYLSKAVYCLYCIWPMLVFGAVWFMNRVIEKKTYFGPATPGVDLTSAAGMAEFDTRRQRDKEQRRNIYWAVCIVLVGYIGAFLWNTFSITAKASQITPTSTLEPSATPSPTETATEPPPAIPAATLARPTHTPTVSPTYAPTATDRVIYLVGPESTVIVTVVVERVVTATFTHTPTQTLTPTITPTETLWITGGG